MKKHILPSLLTVVLAAVLLFALSPAAQAATSGATDNISWTLEDYVLTISGTGEMDKSFSRESFAGEFTEVVITEGITGIPDRAFRDQTNLKSISLPSTLKTIGNQAFYCCFSLSKIEIPEGVTDIGGSVFAQCTKLRSISLPDSLQKLGSYAFYDCEVLRELTIPDGVKEVKNNTFEDCEALIAVTLPKEMTDIGEYAFADCDALRSITVPEGVTVLRKHAFIGCSSLKSVNLPSSLKMVEKYAFQSCEALSSIVIPEGATTIGENVFEYCYGLTSVKLPETLESLGYQAFCGCKSLTEIAIPDSVTSIGNSAFSGCASLTKAKLPASATKISRGMFYGCTALRDVEIPSGVKIIDESAFSGCSALTNIVLPDSLTDLRSCAFLVCASLESISIPAGVDTVCDRVFSACSSLKSVELHDTLKYIESSAFANCDSLKSLTVPEGVLVVEEYAFENCDSLASVDLPDSLETLGYSAFYDCDALKSIEIPKGLTVIDEDTFRDCDALETVTMYGTLKTIEQNAFRNCDVLKSLSIPAGMEHISYSVFRECSALETVEIGEGVTEINGGTFQDCGKLKNVTLPTSLRSVGDSLFKNCRSLEKLVIPEGVTRIEGQAFRNCSSLRSLQLPKSLVSLGGGMIMGCSSLSNLLLYPDATAIGADHEWNGYSHDYFDALCSGSSSDWGGYSYRITLYCYADSFPLTYAINNGIPYVIVDENFDGHMHGYKANVIDPTCTERGFTEYVCECGDKYVDENTYEDAYGHYIGRWEYKEDGSKVGTCERCGETETVEPELAVTYVTLSGVASSGKIKIAWEEVTGAEEYKIYRATSENGTYKHLKTTASDSYTDKSAKAGTKYFYKVQAARKSGKVSEFSGVQYRRCDLPQPKVKESNVSSSGKIKLEWEKIEGAKEYAVYRATSKTGSFTKLAATTAASYTDKTAKAGKVYYYKVKALHKTSTADSAYSSVVSRTCDLAQPKVDESNDSSSGKIELEWKKIDGAKNYTIYRATSKTGSYTKLTTTTAVSYTDKSAKAGKVYYYKVKANHSNSSASSAYSDVVSQTCKLERPDVSVKLSSGKPKLTWDAVSGAKEYTVYRATSKDGEYSALKTTTSEKYTDKSAKKGKTYYYKVKAVHKTSSANSAYSSVDSIKATK